MIALLYVLLTVAAGDVLARRFFTYITWPHRLATAFLVGLLGSSWLTYLTGLTFASHDQPLVAANVITFAITDEGKILVVDRADNRLVSFEPGV